MWDNLVLSLISLKKSIKYYFGSIKLIKFKSNDSFQVWCYYKINICYGWRFLAFWKKHIWTLNPRNFSFENLYLKYINSGLHRSITFNNEFASHWNVPLKENWLDELWSKSWWNLCKALNSLKRQEEVCTLLVTWGHPFRTVETQTVKFKKCINACLHSSTIILVYGKHEGNENMYKEVQILLSFSHPEIKMYECQESKIY